MDETREGNEQEKIFIIVSDCQSAIRAIANPFGRSDQESCGVPLTGSRRRENDESKSGYIAFLATVATGERDCGPAGGTGGHL